MTRQFRSLVGMRAELDELDAMLDRSEAIAHQISERTRYLLNHRLGRRLVATYREWIAEVEEDLAPLRDS